MNLFPVWQNLINLPTALKVQAECKILYALALNGTVRNRNENSTFTLTFAHLSLRSCLCSGYLGLLLHSDKSLISLSLSFAMSSLLRVGFASLTRHPTQNPLRRWWVFTLLLLAVIFATFSIIFTVVFTTVCIWCCNC